MVSTGASAASSTWVESEASSKSTDCVLVVAASSDWMFAAAAPPHAGGGYGTCRNRHYGDAALRGLRGDNLAMATGATLNFASH